MSNPSAITDPGAPMFTPRRLFIIGSIVVILIVLGVLLSGCASGDSGDGSPRRKLDQLLGTWMTYDKLDPQAQADFKRTTLDALLAKAGVTEDLLKDVEPGGLAIAEAQYTVDKRPEWAEHQVTLARLYEVVMYGLPK